jgi:hypothetical protein
VQIAGKVESGCENQGVALVCSKFVCEFTSKRVRLLRAFIARGRTNGCVNIVSDLQGGVDGGNNGYRVRQGVQLAASRKTRGRGVVGLGSSCRR